jgi:pSer/pThr/pTyr-binding forkhead associated (FHA) protein
MTLDEVRTYLYNHAKDLGARGADNEFGYGRVALPEPPTASDTPTETPTVTPEIGGLIGTVAAPVETLVPTVVGKVTEIAPTVEAEVTEIAPTVVAKVTEVLPTAEVLATAVAPGDEDEASDNTFLVFALIGAGVVLLIVAVVLAVRSRPAAPPAASQVPPPPPYTPSSSAPTPVASGPVVAEALVPTPLGEAPHAAFTLVAGGRPYPLRPGENVIGRAPNCAITIPDDTKLSRQHARITVAQGYVSVEDTSTNGTFVNGHRITGRASLVPGESLRCGATVFVLQGPGGGGGSPAQPHFRVLGGAQAGERFVITGGAHTLGRSSQSDFVLRDERVSRQHARVEHHGNDFYLYDAGSSGGTFVNGQRITRHRLQSGDEVRLGNTRLHFELG